MGRQPTIVTQGLFHSTTYNCLPTPYQLERNSTRHQRGATTRRESVGYTRDPSKAVEPEALGLRNSSSFCWASPPWVNHPWCSALSRTNSTTTENLLSAPPSLPRLLPSTNKQQ